ncbi:Lrp/AsnC family transcriptional regulator [Methyloparacoccus murrellii]
MKRFDWPDRRDLALLHALQAGLPLVSRPYAVLGERVGYSEAEVIARLADWQSAGLIKRLGIIVRHRPLGYTANAMVVFDIPDERVRDVARILCRSPYVTLCYRRPRRGTDWPFNLFCMIHGRERRVVEAQIEELVGIAGIETLPRATLFSSRCFKQRGAHYRLSAETLPEPA